MIELPTRDAKHSLNYYEILFNAKYLTEESSREAMYILTQSDFHIGFQARLPKNVRMAHKFGTNQDDHGLFWLHECALVYTEKPYDLCVFTQGRNLYVMRDLLQIISETIYTDQLK